VSSEYARRLHSIRNLKGLQVLKCNGLYKLTDFVLVDAFEFLELKELNFSRCNVSSCTSDVVDSIVSALFSFRLKV
jgi:hypothetical protein